MSDLLLEVDGGVATLSINRPESRNALARRTMAELDAALDELQGRTARVLVVRGVGTQAFCAGGDLKELETMRDEADAIAMARTMRATLDRFPQLDIPVIAGLNGDALGGGAELAIACDFRIAASHARLGFAQINLGLMPAWGAPERLAGLVGRGRALHLLLTGRMLSAGEAYEAGVIEEVVESDRFDERLAALARAVAQAPAEAVAGIKRAVGAVSPHRFPRNAERSIREFARTWTADAHWESVERLERKRRERK